MWIDSAADDLRLARADVPGVVGLEAYCFHAQQCAEKAIKAVLVHLGVEFPYSHNIGRLLDLVRAAGVDVPAAVEPAEALTVYATITRYPFPTRERIAPAERAGAVAAAAAVLAWAEAAVGYSPGA